MTLGTRPDEDATGDAVQSQSHQEWGLAIQDLDPSLAERLGYDRNMQGVIVSQVAPMSPAARAGIQPGDLIQEANRQRVKSVAEFKAVLRQSPPTDHLLLLVKRGQATFFRVLEQAS